MMLHLVDISHSLSLTFRFHLNVSLKNSLFLSLNSPFCPLNPLISLIQPHLLVPSLLFITLNL